MERWLVSLPVLLLVMAGCSGSSDSDAKETKGTVAPTQGTEAAGKGNIVGQIVDDEENPLQGVAVGLLPPGEVTLAFIAETDEAGGFAFNGVEPGSYTFLATKIGYFDFQQKNVQSAADSTTELTIQMLRLPSTEPWEETRLKVSTLNAWGVKSPVIEESYIIPGLGGNNYDSWDTGDRPDALREIVAELQWTATWALAGNLILQVGVEGKSGNPSHQFAYVQAPSPIRVVVPESRILEVLNQGDPKCRLENPPDHQFCEMELFVYGGTGNTGQEVDVALVLQQKYEAAVTMFYRMQAPPDYSFFAG